MDCEIIQDLIPLYLDGCCSEKSAALVKTHIQSCAACRALVESAGAPLPQTQPQAVPKLSRVSQWKASVMQSVLFLVYFAVITLGVALEAGTPSGLMNGFWGFNLVIPATGALMALVNWYFIPLYPSRRAFVAGSVACTLGATACCFLVGAVHYELSARLVLPFAFGYGLIGTVFAGLNTLLSALLSRRYAVMVGKE